MEEKQLNFNQPFLSVRRFSSTSATQEGGDKMKIDEPEPKLPPLPFYKSELKSGPIRNPGTVPFVWEKIPGKPKDERKSRAKLTEQPPIAPKLPPGRVLNVRQETTDKGSRDKISVQSQIVSALSSSKDVSELDKISFSEDKISTPGREDDGSSGSEDGNDAYLDALDTLSRSESFSMNCSMSGVSGLDGQYLKPSGTFSTDPQTRDFMMGRFLPAAKAMASETPLYTPRKRPVVREQGRLVNKAVINVERQSPVNQYRPNSLPPYAQELVREESDDESEIYEGSDIMSSKVCGLFPRFCLKNSLCLLNPVPGMKLQSRLPVLSVPKVQANSSSASSCCETKHELCEDVISDQGSAVQHQDHKPIADNVEGKSKSDEIDEGSGSQKLDQSSLNRHQQDGGRSPYHDRYGGQSPYHDRYSQSKLPEQKGFLGVPVRVPTSGQNGFDIHKSRQANFRDLLANEHAKWEVGFGSPVVEKTLYIDSVHTVKSPSSNSSLDMKGIATHKGNVAEIREESSDTVDVQLLDSSLLDIKQFSAAREKPKLRPKSLESIDSCSPFDSGRLNYGKHMDMQNGLKHDEDRSQDALSVMSSKIEEHENLNSESRQSVKSGQEKCHDLNKDPIKFTSSKTADEKIDLEIPQPLGVENHKSFISHVGNPTTLTNSKMVDHNKNSLETPKTIRGAEMSNVLIQSSKLKLVKNGLIDLESQRVVKLDHESSDESYFEMPLTLATPKSPSESWLKRALPVISSRNSRSSLAARIGASSPMTSPLDAKWETIVKTSNLQHGQRRFQEEQLAPIPEA